MISSHQRVTLSLGKSFCVVSEALVLSSVSFILSSGTSFSRSQLQLVTPLLEALPGLLSPALPNILSLTAG
ncbi:hypothetical protein P8452_12987 [Trifolium repens]|nr:hypothetical protein P8452_12987 [Trifolium repens]